MGSRIFQDRPSSVVPGNVAVINRDDRALGRDVLVPAPPRQEILHGDDREAAVFDCLHLLLKFSRSNRQGVLRPRVFFQPVVAEHDDGGAFVDRGHGRPGGCGRRCRHGGRARLGKCSRSGRRSIERSRRASGRRRTGLGRPAGDERFDFAAPGQRRTGHAQQRETNDSLERRRLHRDHRTVFGPTILGRCGKLPKSSAGPTMVTPRALSSIGHGAICAAALTAARGDGTSRPRGADAVPASTGDRFRRRSGRL